ncbi:MAG: hypothetical protein JO037_15460 [Actinobacteria bacterium]|nr:hypothetical protein [Actinomycetota bacterium]
MSQSLTDARPVHSGQDGQDGQDGQGRIAALGPRRKLQLALATFWLFDAILQFQPSMFGTAFPRMLAGGAQGNPGLVAGPIIWSAGFIDHHLAGLNAVFATMQLALGLGIAWRPTVRLALAASVAWALAVWWLGEGLGGILAGTASPVSGAPGAVILYAVLAVLLWPADRDASAPFVAGRAVGRGPARLVWLAVWGSLAAFALPPASRAIGGTISGMAPGEPAWLAWLDARLGGWLGHHGLAASLVLAAVLAAVAVGVFLPAPARRPVLVLAVAVAAAVWLAEGMGGILTGSGTDPNSGPLLALLALSFWPAAATGPAARGG